MDLSQILEILISATDDSTRNQAEMQLKSAEELNYDQFIIAMCAELVTEGKAVGCRQQAGLYLKNLFTAQDEGIRQAKLAKWNACTTQAQFKVGLIQALSSPVAEASRTAAQAVAALAAIELPLDRWPDLLQTLHTYVTSSEAPELTKVASLDAVGYMCSALKDRDDVDIQNKTVIQVLTIIVPCMDVTKSVEITRAAISATINSLEFTEEIFNNAEQRNAIMTAVCGLSQSPDVRVREKVYQCLADIAELYYNLMFEYMEHLFAMTTQAITTDDPLVAMMAFHFWTSLFSRETEVRDEEGGTSQEIGKKAMSLMAPIIFDSLNKQVETDDSGELTLSDYGELCLQALSTNVKDEILPLALEFVKQNIGNESHWQCRAAALYTFGQLMAPCRQGALNNDIPSSIPFVIKALQSEVINLRSTGVWCLGEISEHYISAVPEDFRSTLVQGMMHLIDDTSEIVPRNAIKSISQFASAFELEEDLPTNGLSIYAEPLLEKLLNTAEAPDCEVVLDSYEAAAKIIEACAQDRVHLVYQVLDKALTKVEGIMQSEGNLEDRDIAITHITGLIQACTLKLPAENYLITIADKLMMVLLHIIQSNSVGGHEDAVNAMGFVAAKLNMNFHRYLQHCVPAIMKGLQMHEEDNVCKLSMSCLGEVCRALGNQVGTDNMDLIMVQLLEVLKSDTAHRDLKPAAIECFSDVAVAFGDGFERYAKTVLEMLQVAQTQNWQSEDYEVIEYFYVLQEEIIKAYSEIFDALKGRKDLLQPYVQNIVIFISVICEQPNRPYKLIMAGFGLLFDVIVIFNEEMKVWKGNLQNFLRYIDSARQMGAQMAALEPESQEKIAGDMEMLAKLFNFLH